jgi:hypothetical protein
MGSDAICTKFHKACFRHSKVNSRVSQTAWRSQTCTITCLSDCDAGLDWFRFIGSSLVVTTNNCYTLKITVIVTHKVFNSHIRSLQVFYEPPVAVSYQELNSSQNQGPTATDSQSWCRAPYDQIFITVWQSQSCLCGAPSLTRGRVCLLSVIVCSNKSLVIM